MRRFISYLALVSLLTLISCAGDELPEYNKLNGARVLAVKADNPELNSAGTVTLEFLLSYPEAADDSHTNLIISYERCLLSTVDFGGEANCDDDSNSLSDEVAIDLSSLSSSNYTGVVTGPTISIDSTIFTQAATEYSALLAYGVNYYIFYELQTSSGQVLKTGFKRIKLSTRSDEELNTNPTITNITLAGEVLTAAPSSSGAILVNVTQDQQSYTSYSNQELVTSTEEYYVTYFSKNGEWQLTRTDEGISNNYTATTNDEVIAIVIRDGRGGVDFTTLVRQ